MIFFRDGVIDTGSSEHPMAMTLANFFSGNLQSRAHARVLYLPFAVKTQKISTFQKKQKYF
jgi:hypothetical protein